jgi:hypothetical protein
MMGKKAFPWLPGTGHHDEEGPGALVPVDASSRLILG